LLIPIPPHDQIMLIGPPYKILDSLVRSSHHSLFFQPSFDFYHTVSVTKQYGPGLNVEGKRIFVFNRRILSDTAKEPQRIRLLPYEVSKPDLTLGKYSLAVPLAVNTHRSYKNGYILTLHYIRADHFIAH
jgi:hypothetical protein